MPGDLTLGAMPPFDMQDVQPGVARSIRGSGGTSVPSPLDPGTAPLTNPHLRIDPALNLVVMEIRGADGRMLDSIPSPHQLEAYRRAADFPAPSTPAPTAAFAPDHDRPAGDLPRVA